MCGIVGILSKAPQEPAALTAMAAALSHRGPDGQGVWMSADGRVGLGHRRLSIVDLSPAGAQPMLSGDGRLVLIFNGEIYNHRELRRELDQVRPHRWRGHSDTETLLEAIAEWGLEAALSKSVGMFALAVWDGATLHLARDRFGEKPLYFGWAGPDFVFGSELGALRLHPQFAGEIEPDAVDLMLRRGYVPAPLSIYRHIYKLDPGCILTADLAGGVDRPSQPPQAGFAAGGLAVRAYWSYADMVRQGLGDPVTSVGEALEQLDGALRAAVADQTSADVPVGVFLSSGVDSSTIAAVMATIGAPLRTYSLGVESSAHNEAPQAGEFARALGTDHHEIMISTGDIARALERMPGIYDEPFGDSSQIPTWLLAEFARPSVKVALCGDGGDELFGGYNRHISAARYLPVLDSLPPALRRPAASALGRIPPGGWNFLLGRAPDHYLGHKARKALKAASQTDELSGILSRFVDEWPGDRPPLPDIPDRAGQGREGLGIPAPAAVELMYLDAVTYLPDDLLTKVDRAAMSVGLETRTPYLDHRVAAVAARIPQPMKISGDAGKRILRQVLDRHAPGHGVSRTKAGFGIPVAGLLRGPLREWAGDLLSLEFEGGTLDPGAIRTAWSQHLAGTHDWSAGLWPFLMFQSWRAAHRGRVDLPSTPRDFAAASGLPHAEPAPCLS